MKKIVISLTAFFILIGLSYKANASDARKMYAAGSFYPADSAKLYDMINVFFEKVPKQTLDGKIIALMVPHAGYQFSGQVAAYSYKLIKDKKIDTVIVIGASHNFPLRKAAVYDSGSFKTPLGDVRINEKLAGEIINSSNLFYPDKKVHEPEHSLEVQLPFLQCALKQFDIVPILTGEMSFEEYEKMSESLSNCIKGKENVLIVISTDMSHYPSYENANLADKTILKAVRTMDPEVIEQVNNRILEEKIPELHCVLCGKSAVILGMMTAKKSKASKATVLKYANSADSEGDKSKVVGYSALAFIKAKEDQGQFILDKKSKDELLLLAKNSIYTYLENGRYPKFTEIIPESISLFQKGAAFVTLRINNELKGCIGRTVAVEPLFSVVSGMAISSAFEDTRFSALTKKEFEKLSIEISVLSPLKKIKNTDEIIMGKHGVVVRKGNRRGLFLPQVATETGWKKEKFLKVLCEQKAGLPEDAWKEPDAEIFIFTVDNFEKNIKDIK